MFNLRSEPVPKWLPLLFLGIGILFVILAGAFRYSAIQFNKSARATDGIVIRLVENNRQKSPVVRFRLPTGEAVTFESSLSTNPPRYTIEQKVIVSYDPENPENAMIDDWLEEWFITIIFGGLGSIFSLIGLGAFFTVRRI